MTLTKCFWLRKTPAKALVIVITLMRYASDVSTSPHSERIRRSSKGYFRSEIVSPTPMQTE